MKIQILHLLILLVLQSTFSFGQNTELVAPADVVISQEYSFDINGLKWHSDTTFGQLLKTVGDRKQIKTVDKVCSQYCLKVPCNGYDGLVSGSPIPKPVSNLACDYYHQYFDSLQSDKKHVLDWGLDGYYLNAGGNIPSITVVDKRVLAQDRKSLLGSILRIYSLLGFNSNLLFDTQTIWIVDCNIDTNFVPKLACLDRIPLYLDANCTVSLKAENILEGGPYNCWDSYEIMASAWNDPNNILIDRDSVLNGVQLDFQDLEDRFTIIVQNPQNGNTCWGVATVRDTLPAEFNYPDTVFLNCKDLWEVPLPSFKENCHASVQFGIEIKVGTVINDGKGGYRVINIPSGIHAAKLISLDQSGNLAEKAVTLIVTNKAPRASCMNSLEIKLNESNCVELEIEDINLASHDNCFMGDVLKFYFNGDPTKSLLQICCDDFVKTKAHLNLTFDAELWVEDEEGLTDSCKTMVTVIDNRNICADVVNSIDPFLGTNLSVFPNLGNGTIYIHSKAPIDHIRLSNLLGVPHSIYKVSDQHNLTISDLPSDLYFIEALSKGKKLAYKKVIVLND